jgi:hypothetical protein
VGICVIATVVFGVAPQAVLSLVEKAGLFVG